MAVWAALWVAGALSYEWTWAWEAGWWLWAWQVKAFGWAGATSKFVGRKLRQSGGLLCCERQAALPRVYCTPKEMREQLGLAELFLKSFLCNSVDVCYGFFVSNTLYSLLSRSKIIFLLRIFNKSSKISAITTALTRDE